MCVHCGDLALLGLTGLQGRSPAQAVFRTMSICLVGTRSAAHPILSRGWAPCRAHRRSSESCVEWRGTQASVPCSHSHHLLPTCRFLFAMESPIGYDLFQRSQQSPGQTIPLFKETNTSQHKVWRYDRWGLGGWGRPGADLDQSVFA